MILSENMEQLLGRIGSVISRWSLVLFFLGFGLYKFTPQEAAGVAPLLTHSPVFFWAIPALGQQGASNFVGVLEILFAVLIALRPIKPRWSGYGSLATAGALVVTLSFLFTTPHLDPALGGFIIKDLTLLGAALWSAGEAFAAARARANRDATATA
ncbi:MAG: DUF417 family protein [Sphingomonas sp.]